RPRAGDGARPGEEFLERGRRSVGVVFVVDVAAVAAVAAAVAAVAVAFFAGVVRSAVSLGLAPHQLARVVRSPVRRRARFLRLESAVSGYVPEPRGREQMIEAERAVGNGVGVGELQQEGWRTAAVEAPEEVAGGLGGVLAVGADPRDDT